MQCIWVQERKETTGIFLCMCPANERRRYSVTSSLTGWTHSQKNTAPKTWKRHFVDTLCRRSDKGGWKGGNKNLPRGYIVMSLCNIKQLKPSTSLLVKVYSMSLLFTMTVVSFWHISPVIVIFVLTVDVILVTRPPPYERNVDRSSN